MLLGQPVHYHTGYSCHLYPRYLREVTGPIDFIHQFVDMEQYTLSDGSKTCTAAMGYSFAAGTADGPSTLLPHVSEN